MTKLELYHEILRFLGQRPRIDPRNYCTPRDNGAGWRLYRKEASEVARDKRDALSLLAWAYVHVDEPFFVAAFALPGERLCLNEGRLKYTTGQYWPTEYRKAVCRRLASLFWHSVPFEANNHRKTVQAKAKRAFSRGVVARWFN